MPKTPDSDRILKIVYTSHTIEMVDNYLKEIQRLEKEKGSVAVESIVGANLWKYFKHKEITDFQALTAEELLQAILRTKNPMLMAEQKTKKEQDLHNEIEDKILGDVATITEVKVFNNGAKNDDGSNQSILKRKNHKKPHKQMLINISAPVLKKGLDVDGIVSEDGKTMDDEKYYTAIERILLPSFLAQNQICKENGKKAIITMPGIGCAAFAGIFRGKVEDKLIVAIQKIFEKHGDELSEIHGIVMDTYNRAEHQVYELNKSTGAKFVVAPSHQAKVNKEGYKCLAQLSTDKQRAKYFNALEGNEKNQINKNKVLGVTIIAGDKFSCIGNELNKIFKSQASNEPMVVGATDAQEVHSGVKGMYDKHEQCFALSEKGDRTYHPAFESKRFEMLTIDDKSKAFIQLKEKEIDKQQIAKSSQLQEDEVKKVDKKNPKAEKVVNDAVKSISYKQTLFAMGAGFLVGAAIAAIAVTAGAALPVYATVAVAAVAITVVSAILIQRNYFPDVGVDMGRS